MHCADGGESECSDVKKSDMDKFPILKTCEPDYRSPLVCVLFKTNGFPYSPVQKLRQIYDNLDAAVRQSVKEADVEKRKKGKKPARRTVIKRGFMAEKLQLPEPHNNTLRTYRWAVDQDWLEAYNDRDQALVESDDEIAAPTWTIHNAKGKQPAKEIYYPKPKGPTNGVPDLRRDDSDSPDSSSESD